MPDWKMVPKNPEQSLLPKLPSTSGPSTPSKLQRAGSILKRDVRDVGRTVARAGEAVLGTPGNLLNLGLGAANYLSGGAVPTYGQVQEKLAVSLPTSSQIGEKVNKLTGGYLAPESPGEELYDSIVQDFASLLVPTGVKNPSSLLKTANLARAGIQSVAGNLAAKAAENLGVGKTGQAVANVGTSLLAGIVGGKIDLNSRMKNAFQAAEKSAEGQAIGSPLSSKLSQTFRNIKKSLPEDYPAKEFIDKRIATIEKWLPDIPQKQFDIPVSKISNKVSELNEFYKDAQKYPRGAYYLNKVTQPFRDTLDEFSKSAKTPQAKEFARNYYEARDLWKGFNTSSAIGSFLNKHVDPKTLKNPIAKSLLYASPWFNKVPHVLGALGVAKGTKELVRLIDLMATSKEAAKAMLGIGTGALNHSASQVDRNIKLFDNAVSKSGFLPEGAKLVPKEKN